MKKATAFVLSALMVFSPMAVMLNVSESVEGRNQQVKVTIDITDANDLQDMNLDLAGDYELTNDIDASIIANFDPVGDTGTPFTGAFDGHNFTISNLFINRPGEQFVGLFGAVDNNVPVRNVIMSDVDITGDSYCAGMVGYSEGNVQNCHVTGTITSTWWVGGVVGDNDPPGVVQDCTFEGDVTASNDYSGGVVGRNDETIVNCTAKGNVSGGGSVGGLAGFSGGTFGSTSDSRANTVVVGTGDYVGGLVGRATRPITNCVAVGNTTGSGIWIGGLAGSSTNTVTNCHTYVNVSGTGAGSQQVGGLIGVNSGAVTDCTAAGIVNNTWDWTGGLFGANHAAVSNCTSSADVIGLDRIGGFAGWNSGGPIDNCSFTGTVDGQNQAGGFIGHHDDPNEIVDCFVIGDLILSNVVGGLIGWCEAGSGDIRNCYFIGDLTSTSGWAGGLIGRQQSVSSVDNCFAIGNVTSSSGRTGGLIGANSGFVNESYFIGNVKADANVGGLIGQNFGTVNRSYCTGTVEGTMSPGASVCGGFAGQNAGNGNITNCYATSGVISAGPLAGGFIAWNTATVNWSYCTGLVTSGGAETGGFIGRSGGILDNILWDNETTGQPVGMGDIPDPPEVVGKNTTDLMQQATYSSWDFGSKWVMWENETRPFLQAEHGTNIWNSHQVQLMAMNLTADYELMADVDMDILDAAQMWGTSPTQGKGFLPIGNGTNNFNGTFDRSNSKIDNLFINRSSEYYVALFGRLGSSARVSNITLENVNVTGYWYVSGLIAYNDGGTVTSCNSTGNVSGQEDVGGLIGNNDLGTVDNCHIVGIVNGTSADIGGLIGWNKGGTVTNSTADADISWADIYAGGLIGYSSGQVTNCTAYGNTTGTGNWVGGLMGQFLVGTVTGCSAHGNADGSGNVGGLIGENSAGTISDCESYGETTGGGANVGGLIGDNNNPVTGCTANGNVTGNSFVGGLIGANAANGIVTNCEAHGQTNGTGDAVGGLVGENRGIITDSNSTGATTGHSYVGGFAGASNGNIEKCHGTGNVTGTGDVVGGFLGYHADTGIVANSSSTGSVIGGNFTGGFIGANENSTATNHCNSSGDVNGSVEFIGGFIGVNIDSNISDCHSTGDVDGQDGVGGFAGGNVLGGQIDNCHSTGNVSGTLGVGGFAGGNEGGNVTNCQGYGNAVATGDWAGGLIGQTVMGIVTNCSAHGNASGKDNVGGLVGEDLSSTFKHCAAFGNASGTDNVGGFMGLADDTTIEESYAEGDSTGVNQTGGFLGFSNDDTGVVDIINCYAQGDVTGTGTSVGGLVGEKGQGNVINSYSSGAVSGGASVGGLIGFRSGVGNTNDSFWDNQTSGQANSDGGIGKSTIEMMQQGTFDPPWDFTNIWGIHEANTYPFLLAFGIPALPSVDLNVSIEASPMLVGVNGYLYYYLNVTNDGPDNAVDVNVTTSVQDDVTYNSDNATASNLWGSNLSWDVGTLNNGDTAWMVVNVTVNPGSSGLILIVYANGTSTTTEDDWSNNNDTVQVTVNSPPVANDDSDTTDEDTVLNVAAPGLFANDNDPDTGLGDSIALDSFQNPSASGAAVVVNGDGSFSYDPTGVAAFQALAVGEYSIDTFDYTIIDTKGNTSTATVTINVTGVNDVPTANDDNAVVAEDSVANAIEVLANDTDTDTNDVLLITVVTQGANGTVVITGNGASLTYEPDANFTGTDSFTYTISDGNGGTDTATVNVTVTGVNDQPLAEDDAATVDEDSSANAIDVLANDLDIEGDTLTITAVSQGAHGSVVITGGGTGLTYEPDAEYFGTDTFIYSVYDGNGGTDTATVTVTVSNINDFPTIQAATAPDGLEGELYTLTLNATDIDGDVLSWSGLSDGLWLRVNSNGVVNGTPTAAGTFWVLAIVNDGHGGTDNINLTFVIDPDLDGDGITDALDDDRDGDGTDNPEDAFPDDSSEDTDTDDDGIGNNADPDDDNDGVGDDEDPAPLDPDVTGAEGGIGEYWWIILILIVAILLVIAGMKFIIFKGEKIPPEEAEDEMEPDVGEEEVEPTEAAEPESETIEEGPEPEIEEEEEDSLEDISLH